MREMGNLVNKGERARRNLVEQVNQSQRDLEEARKQMAELEQTNAMYQEGRIVDEITVPSKNPVNPKTSFQNLLPKSQRLQASLEQAKSDIAAQQKLRDKLEREQKKQAERQQRGRRQGRAQEPGKAKLRFRI